MTPPTRFVCQACLSGHHGPDCPGPGYCACLQCTPPTPDTPPPTTPGDDAGGGVL